MGEINFQTLISSMASQLKAIEQLNLFNEAEIGAIRRYRKFFKWKLSKEDVSCEDIMQYVRYELDLLALIREKKVDLTLFKKKNMVTYSSGNCLKHLFSMLTGKFPNVLQLWFLYVKFCQEIKDNTTLLSVIDNMLKVHSDKPSVFQLASRCAMEDFDDLERARGYLLKGIHLHLDSSELYRETFLLELSIAKKKYDSSSDPSKEDLPSLRKMIEFVYDAAIRMIHSVEFYIDILRSIRGIPFAEPLENRIYEDLQKKFPDKEITWDTLAKIKLEQLKIPSNQPNVKKIIKEVNDIYKKAVEQHLNTPTMWKMYLDQLIEINNDASVDFPGFKKNFLITALMAAHEKRQLNDKYYLIWSKLKADTEYQLTVLKIAIKTSPTSVSLWSTLIVNRLAENDEKEAWEMFNKAMKHLKGDLSPSALMLWKFMLRYYQCSRPDAVEQLFEEGIKESSNVSAEVKVLYVEWMTISQGILKGRRLYDRIAVLPPFSLPLHEKMIELESYQVVLNLRSLRKCHQLAIDQFGAHNIDVWMRHLRFERNYGKSKRRILNIKKMAMEVLQPAFIDEFTAEMRLFMVNCLSSSKRQSAAQDLNNSLNECLEKKRKLNSGSPQDLVPTKRRKYHR